MTSRARWLMLIGLVGLFAGVLRGQVLLSLLSLSTFAWILVEWFRFQKRVHFNLPRLKFERLVNGRSESQGSLWVGRLVHIELRLESSSEIAPMLQIRDVVPEIFALQMPEVLKTTTNQPQLDKQSLLERVWKRVEAILGNPPSTLRPPNQWTIDSGCDHAEFKYAVQLRSAGQATLPGVRLMLEDSFGFFRMHRFVPVEQRFLLLPDFYSSAELRPTVKRQNSLPQHGIHRLQRSGTGAELLELREYVPGDPPKSIAWKVSARRDNLMTRKYESEVPVRLHLFVDGSFSTRIGGFGLRLLDQINFVAASVGRAAISVGDPVSGMLVDETQVVRLPWLAGDRGFLQLTKALAEFATARPPIASSPTAYMMLCAMRVCNERYPELLSRRYQRIPFSFFHTTREKYRLAGVLAELFKLSASEHVECIHDREKLAHYAQELLHRAGMPWMAPMISGAPDPAVSGAVRMQLLSDAMAKAIAHARDNEVFVVLADLLSCAPNLPQLLKVVKLALAKHHRVAFVCPTTTFMRPNAEIIEPKSASMADLLLAAEQARIRDLAMLMKRELRRLGVSVAFAGERTAVQMIIAEMDLARDGRTLLQGSRS